MFHVLTIEMMIMEEQGPTGEVAALDQAMQIDEDDEEQALSSWLLLRVCQKKEG